MKIGKKAEKQNPALKPLQGFIGKWKTKGAHPLVPGVTLHGHASFDWLEDGAFLIVRFDIEHELFPDGISIIGTDNTNEDGYMLYFDERGVSRKMDVQFQGNVLKWWRTAPEFSQRYTLTLSIDRNTIDGKGEMSKDGVNWEQDLDLSYKRID